MPYQDLINEPTYQISLQDLISFFKVNQLPAWVITPDIYIDITLQDSLYRTICSVDANIADSFTINKTETKLIIDHIFYPTDVMEAWANANKKVQFSYFDYRQSKMSVTANQLQQTIVRNLGGAGRIVTKVISGLFDENNNTGGNTGSSRTVQQPVKIYTTLNISNERFETVTQDALISLQKQGKRVIL